MNLSSKANFKDDYENSNKSSDSCGQILKCGTPGGAISIASGTLSGTTFIADTLTLNTSCLCDPCAKLEFSSTLAYSSPTTIDSTVVNFQVFKLCDNQRNPIPDNNCRRINTKFKNFVTIKGS